MPAFRSRVDTAAESFAENRRAMLELVDELRALEARAVAVSNRRAATFEARGQLPPRERLARLLDPGMPFLRLHTLCNYLVEDPDPDTSVPGGSVILGIGFIRGTRCMVWVDDSGVRAGTATRGGWLAALNAQELAMRHKLPLVHLVESAGANLMEYQVELWADAGKLFGRRRLHAGPERLRHRG
jgi:geranyl-CoA carboxylase beta subunit